MISIAILYVSIITFLCFFIWLLNSFFNTYERVLECKMANDKVINQQIKLFKSKQLSTKEQVNYNKIIQTRIKELEHKCVTSDLQDDITASFLESVKHSMQSIFKLIS